MEEIDMLDTAMKKLQKDDLYSLEQYAAIRPDFRTRIMVHKKNRVVPIGPNATFHFEDHMTIQYQVQEMLRAERIFETEGIQGELDVYNPLVPDGANWKVTFMIEYAEVEERQTQLARMHGIEELCWVRVEGFDPVYAIADEDLERENVEKTSAVHFLRFELKPEMVAAAKNNTPIFMGIDHEAYHHEVTPLAEHHRASLVADLD
jgi:hypothetical protein